MAWAFKIREEDELDADTKPHQPNSSAGTRGHPAAPDPSRSEGFSGKHKETVPVSGSPWTEVCLPPLPAATSDGIGKPRRREHQPMQRCVLGSALGHGHGGRITRAAVGEPALTEAEHFPGPWLPVPPAALWEWHHDLTSRGKKMIFRMTVCPSLGLNPWYARVRQPQTDRLVSPACRGRRGQRRARGHLGMAPTTERAFHASSAKKAK